MYPYRLLDVFTRSCLVSGLSLLERLSLRRTQAEKESAQSEPDTERAVWRLQEWKKQHPFDNEEFFAQRLAADQMTENDLLSLLAESAETLRDCTTVPPDWLLLLASLFENVDAFREFTLPEVAGLHQRFSVFLEATRPFVKWGFDQMGAGIAALIKKHGYLPFDPAAIKNLLYANVSQLLLSMLNKTLMLELNIARLQGNLRGDTPEERFDSFIGRDGQLFPREVAVLEDIGTDQMKIALRRVEISGSHNRPSLNGTEIDIVHYREHVLAGFTNMYRLLQAHREALLSIILPRFAHDTVRFILRPTRIYMRILQESMHPTVLQDALDRDCLFDCLWRSVEQLPCLARTIISEREDFYAGDVPMFTTHPDSVNIFTSRGMCIPDFLEAPGLEMVKRRLHALSTDDLNIQCRSFTPPLPPPGW